MGPGVRAPTAAVTRLAAPSAIHVRADARAVAVPSGIRASKNSDRSRESHTRARFSHIDACAPRCARSAPQGRSLIRSPQVMPRILVTNDDGYFSPGLIALADALRP